MYKTSRLLKKAFTPITIMLIPHSDRKSVSIKVPSIGILASVVIWCIGMGYVFSIAIDAVEYNNMKQKVSYYSAEFLEMKSTVAALKMAEAEFHRLFSFKSKEKVLENIDASDKGSIDVDNLKQQIMLSLETVDEIKDYLRKQHDRYVSIPKGWPVRGGHITSSFGNREHPRRGDRQFHTGIDIAADSGRPVTATADGVVSFANWSGGSGNLVAIEHGFGFSTYYAHNQKLSVRIGQMVKRGDVIGYVGSTGNSTGPHVHYEVWKDGKPMNPSGYLNGRA